MAKRETMETVKVFIFLGSKIIADSDCSQEIKTLASWKESYDKPRECIKKHRHHFADKNPYSQNYSFSSSPVLMWELDHKEIWVLKNWCFQIVVLEKTLESPLNCREIRPVNPKGNQPWIFIGRTGAEVLIFGPPDVKSWLWKRLWYWGRLGQEEKGRTENEMAGWHHWLNGQEFEQTLGDTERQGSLVWYTSRSHKESGLT